MCRWKKWKGVGEEGNQVGIEGEEGGGVNDEGGVS